MILHLLGLSLLGLSNGATEDGWIVQTSQGPVRGFLGEAGHYEFFGIPYATAPRGDHKFKAPLDPPTWTDILDATNHVTCPQHNLMNLSKTASDEESEEKNCLVVNVFVPKTKKKNLIVIAYVHGGAFIMGYGDMFDHRKLIEKEVIIVNFNYRLGVHGFLCLGTKDVPGNAGMKDQVAALRWIKKNIANFGGNADDITIAGYSAGSASVEHLMLSPMAKGLFTKVIPESGSTLSPWAITPDPIAAAKRYMLDISGKSTDDVSELEKFFKSLSYEKLTEKIYMSEPKSSFEFAPCVEANVEGEETFFYETPINIMRRGNYAKVPIMIGFASEEGLFRINVFDEWSEKMEENFAEFLPQDLTFANESEKKRVAAEVKRFYFQDNPINVDRINNYVNYFTDILFSSSTIRSARFHARNSVPVYLYDYSYIFSKYIPHPHSDKFKGANHCAQSAILARPRMFPHLDYSNDDLLVQDRLAEMWVNFAKFGSPIPEPTSLLPVSWLPLDPAKLNYCHIDLEMKSAEGLLAERVHFWDDIYSRYYREPTPPGHTERHSEL